MAVSSYVVLIRRDIFAFVMTIYVASHFSYGDNHGGLWNLLAVVVVSIFFPLSTTMYQLGGKYLNQRIIRYLYSFKCCGLGDRKSVASRIPREGHSGLFWVYVDILPF